MATRRKTAPTVQPNASNSNQYREFVKNLLAGQVAAERLVETRDSNGRVTKLEYDDPNG